MPAITDGKENFKDGPQISRRNVLIGGAATLAGAAMAGRARSPTMSPATANTVSPRGLCRLAATARRQPRAVLSRFRGRPFYSYNRPGADPVKGETILAARASLEAVFAA
jgi:hypothetical protein